MPHTCPHCNYDQSGTIAAWDTACPLTATCSECGQSFEWREVFSTHQIPWLYEHRRGPAILTAWKTWARALHPNLFWSRIALRRVHPWRLLTWLTLILFTTHLVRGTLYTAVAWWTYHKHPGMVSNWQYLPWYGYAWSWPFCGFIVGSGWWPVSWSIRAWPMFLWTSEAMSTASAAGLIFLRRRPDLPHIFRAWIYSHAWLAALGLIAITDLLISLFLLSIGHRNGGSPYTGFYYFRSFLGYYLLRALPAAPIIAIALWQAWWWNRAMKKAWRMPTRDFLLLLMPALLAAAAAAWAQWSIQPHK